MDYDLQRIRQDFPLLNDWTYLNTGTLGLLAEPVLETHLENITAYERGGHTGEVHAREGYERARQRLAEFVGVDASQIALNRNATDGINTIAAAFPLRDGDEVVTSTEEHPAMVIPWLAACERTGATLRFIDISPDEDAFATSLTSAVSDRTRIVALSHVSCETGTRVPVELTREIVPDHARVLIDASQSIGQFRFQLSDLNADYVIGNGHKWLCGPNGTGFIWIHPDALADALPVHYASDVVEPHWSRAYYQQASAPRLQLFASARRFEFGTRAWHHYGALEDAIDCLEALDLAQVEEHVRGVSDYLKAKLQAIEGVTLHTPLEWCDSSGIVTFALEGWTGEDLSKHLWYEKRIAQRRVEAPSSVRISCAFFTSESDIDQLIEAIEQAC